MSPGSVLENLSQLYFGTLRGTVPSSAKLTHLCILHGWFYFGKFCHHTGLLLFYLLGLFLEQHKQNTNQCFRGHSQELHILTANLFFNTTCREKLAILQTHFITPFVKSQAIKLLNVLTSIVAWISMDATFFFSASCWSLTWKIIRKLTNPICDSEELNNSILISPNFQDPYIAILLTELHIFFWDQLEEFLQHQVTKDYVDSFSVVSRNIHIDLLPFKKTFKF